MDVSVPNVTVHTIGEPLDPDLIGRVRTFTLRASAAFNATLVVRETDVALIGCEWSSIPVLQILCATHKTPALLTLHSLERQRSDMSTVASKQIEELEIQGLQLAKAVIALGDGTVTAARKLVPDDAAKIRPLAETFSVATFRKDLDAGAIKAKHTIGPVDPTILYCGILDEDHGADLLIKAVPGILKEHKQARFVFVGDGPLFWTLRIYARYLNLEHAVRVTGHLDGEALNELIQAADIVIAPSRKPTENWPILAGWSAGKAVVASHEAASTLVEHEQNGVLIYPLADSCAWGVNRILTDPYLWGRIKENGAAKATADFGENALAEQLEKALSGL